MNSSDPIFVSRTACRSCGGLSVQEILDLGEIPLADVLIDKFNSAYSEFKIPANLVFCSDCFLVQLKEDVSPQVLFNENYPYYTSVSEEVRFHFQSTASRILEKLGKRQNPKIVEAASNDGYLLSLLMQKGCQVLGIEPSSGPAATALKNNIPTEVKFFDSDYADLFLANNEKVDAFLCNNGIAHVPRPNDFLTGVRMMISENGFAEFEFPWALNTFSHNQFDQIFHQHFSYFSLHSFQILLERNGMVILDVEKIQIHGGSLRVFAGIRGNSTFAVQEILAEERQAGLTKIDFYLKFAERVFILKERLFDLMSEIKSSNKTIGGYGAAGKANTLLSFTETAGFLEWIADINPYKQGKKFPGNHLQIISLEQLKSDPPDYLLILAWNFAPAIMKQLDWFTKAGGKFIVPVPFPVII